MGLLRFYLALCVIGTHATPVLPWEMHGGDQAVQVFYIISGFYMAMVLTASRYAHVRQFYASRFLRIFPVTWVVLAGVVLVSLLTGVTTGYWNALAPYVAGAFQGNGVTGVVVAALSNVTLVGQDWVMFLSQEKGAALHFTSNFWGDRHPLWYFLLLPQAWSIGLELTFYLLAPALVRQRTSVIVAIAGLSLAARVLAYVYLGLAHDPWTSRFFPFELALFCFGILAFRLYEAVGSAVPAGAPSTAAGFFALSAASLLVFYWMACLVARFAPALGLEYRMLLSYPVWSVLIVGLFLASRKNRFDRMLGELSFPIYLVHYLVISLVDPMLRLTKISGTWLGPLSACASIAASVGLYKWCIEPLDRVRHGLAAPTPRRDGAGGP